jgi:ABC-type transporter Mla MlaB component
LGPRTIQLVVGGRLTTADIPALCERVRIALERSGADLVTCDVGAITAPDIVAVEALARLQLTARRQGRSIRFHRASGELQQLLELVGLGDLVRRRR